MNDVPTNPNRSPRSVAQRAAGAMLRRRIIDAMGYWLVWTFAAALILISLTRLIGWEIGSQQWWGWLIVAGVLSIIPSMISAMKNRMNIAQGGGLLDDRLGLKSQIRSAIELDVDRESKALSPGFVALAQAQAESAAGEVQVGRAFDPVETKNWWRAGLVLMLTIAAGIWMPMRVGAEGITPNVIPNKAIASIDSIEDVIDDDSESEIIEESPEVQEAIADLESLKEELAQGVQDPDQANAQTAAKLEQLAKALDDQSEREQEQANELADRIAQAQNQSQGDAMEDQAWEQQLDDFADAIKEQEFADAQEQLDELREQLDQMSDVQREELADQLEQLADAVEPDSLEDEPVDEPAKELADSIREEADEIREPEDLEPEPEVDPEQDETTESNDEDSGEEQSGEQGSEQDSQQDSEQQGDESGEDQSDQQSEQRAEEENSGDESQSEEGDQGESDDETRSESGDQEEQGAGEERETQEQGGNSDEEKESGTQSDQESNEQQQEQGQEEDGQDQGQGESASEEDGEQEQRGMKEGEEGEEGESDQEMPRKGRRSLDDALEEMEKRKERSQWNQEQADEIREQAKKLIDPDQSQQDPSEGEASGVRSNENQQKQSTGPGDDPRNENDDENVDDPYTVRDFVPVDASDKELDQAGDPVGKWYAPDGEASEPAEASKTAQRFREASQKAQRALDEQQVPRKYRHLVREVFKRVEDRADAIESGGKIAPQGKDASSKSQSKSTSGSEE